MANNTNLSYPSAFCQQFLDRNGNPLSGGKLYTYKAGTSNERIATYKTIGGTFAENTNTNPTKWLFVKGIHFNNFDITKLHNRHYVIKYI